VHPVVKGDAYGHGAVPVARALDEAGADGFCVATMDEAIALRDAGIQRPILVAYPIPPALAAEARRRGVSITVGDRELLDELLDAVAADSASQPLVVQIEIETGLGRGGFRGEDAIDAARRIGNAHALRLAGAWTHLQAPEDESRSRGQVDEFERVTKDLEARVASPGVRHVSASGSLVLGGAASLDGVRPGLAMYGLVPDELLGADVPAGARSRTLSPEAAALRPVLSLRARPVHVAELPEGWGISYGPTFTTSRPSRIATLPIGYGDGWSRALSNRAAALVRGRRVPLVGNVAMDAVMADVTDVPGEPVTVHDEFVLIGAQGDERITAAEVAKARGTNSWEVVTSLAARLPRVYHAASVPRETRTLTGDAFPDPGGDRVGGRRSMRP
jgi:alanine racemase